jgi:predicted nucleic acid-binding protein
VTRYLIETNIISNLVKPVPSESLVGWMADQLDDDLHISAWTAAEVRRGILEMPVGRKR